MQIDLLLVMNIKIDWNWKLIKNKPIYLYILILTKGKWRSNSSHIQKL